MTDAASLRTAAPSLPPHDAASWTTHRAPAISPVRVASPLDAPEVDHAASSHTVESTWEDPFHEIDPEAPAEPRGGVWSQQPDDRVALYEHPSPQAPAFSRAARRPEVHEASLRHLRAALRAPSPEADETPAPPTRRPWWRSLLAR